MIQIYFLRCPEGKVRYVGACHDPKQMLQKHLRDCVTGVSPLHRWLRHLQVREQKPKLQLLHEVDDSDREHAQTFWIRHLLRKGVNLVNEIHKPLGDKQPPVSMEAFSRLKKGDVLVMRKTLDRFTVTEPPIPGSMTAWGKPEGQNPKWPTPLWRMRVARICTKEL